MLPVSTLSNPSAVYAAQSALSPAARVSPKLSSSFSTQLQKATARQTEDVFERRDGSVATQNDFVQKQSGSDMTAEEASAKIRDRADKIRQDMEEKAAKPKKEKEETDEDKQVRKLLHEFVGQVLFGQMIKSMRATQEQNPYFHGGRTEEIFQGQLDEILTKELTKASSGSLSEPMYKLMTASDRITD